MQFICGEYFNACHAPPQGSPTIIFKTVAECRSSVCLQSETTQDWFHKILPNPDERDIISEVIQVWLTLLSQLSTQRIIVQATFGMRVATSIRGWLSTSD